MNRLIRNIAFILFLLSPVYGSAQLYNFALFQPDDGLLHAEVNFVIQDTRGYIWAATNSGVSRFDGIEFVNYSVEEGLPAGEVISLMEDEQGRIWASVLGKGVHIIADGRVNEFAQNTRLPSAEVHSMLLDPDHGIWLGTFQGACLINGDSIQQTISSTEGLAADNLHTICKSRDGSIWFGTFGSGVTRMKDGEFWSYNTSNGLVHNYVTGIIQDKNGDMIISTLGGISIQKRDQFINITRDQGLINSQTNAISLGPKGRIWLASFDGVTVLDRKGPIYVSTENGLSHNEVRSVMHDDQGNTWLGTKKGLCRLNSLRTRYLTNIDNEDLEIEPTDFIASNRGMLVSNAVGGIYTYANGRYIPMVDDFDLLDHPVSTMIMTEDSTIWAGTSDFSGLMSIGHNQLSIYADEFGLADNNINCLALTRTGEMLIGTPSGLSLYDGDFRNVMMEVDLDNMNVTSLEVSESGTWYIGFFNGDVLSGSEQSLSKLDPNITKSAINDLLEIDGKLWVATEGDGLYLIGDSILRFASETGLPSNNVRGLAYNGDRLYVTTAKGLAEYADDNGWVIRSTLTNSNGLTWSDCQAKAIRIQDHELWVGTSSGVVVFNLDELPESIAVPRLQLGQLQLFYKDVDWGSRKLKVDKQSGLPINLKLGYQDNYLRFHFTGIDHANPEGVSYQWKLEGFDQEWNPPTDLRMANYPNLPPGDYVFRLKSCNYHGNCTHDQVAYAFVIRPPFWQTLWFYLLLAVAAIAGTVGYIKWREKRLIEEKEVLEATVHTRTKQLREQKEIVEAQHEHITEGIEYAKNIQMAILPSEVELKEAFNDHFVLYSPKETVGGDFYWMFQEDGIVWAAAVDCTGHGVSGAFMSMIGSDLLNQIVIEKRIREPELILAEMDKGIELAFAQSAKEFESDQGMDVALVRIDTATNKVDFAGALRPIYAMHKGELIEHEGDRLAVSSSQNDEQKKFTRISIELSPGDTIYLSSDGFADQFGGPKGKKFMTRRLKDIITENHHLNMEDQRSAFKKALDEWKGTDFSQIDDIVIFGIRL